VPRPVADFWLDDFKKVTTFFVLKTAKMGFTRWLLCRRHFNRAIKKEAAIVLETMGLQPTAIPALVRWQGVQGELLYPDEEEG